MRRIARLDSMAKTDNEAGDARSEPAQVHPSVRSKPHAPRANWRSQSRYNQHIHCFVQVLSGFGLSGDCRHRIARTPRLGQQH